MDRRSALDTIVSTNRDHVPLLGIEQITAYEAPTKQQAAKAK